MPSCEPDTAHVCRPDENATDSDLHGSCPRNGPEIMCSGIRVPDVNCLESLEPEMMCLPSGESTPVVMTPSVVPLGDTWNRSSLSQM